MTSILGGGFFAVEPGMWTPVPGMPLELWHNSEHIEYAFVFPDESQVDLPTGPDWSVRLIAGRSGGR